MNVDLGIKLQAYLDGELAGGEAQQMAALLESDAPARALFDELQQTRMLLQGNEPEWRLPEAPEFFWSKIEREIARAEAAPVREPAWILFLRRHARALASVSVATALLMFFAFQMNIVPRELFEEIDNPLDDTGAFSFRSESQKMTLVWIANPFVDDEVSDGMPMPVSEEIQ